MTMTKKRWTKAETEAFVAEKFTDRIAWVAARTLLERVRSDRSYAVLDPDTRSAIATFLEKHPAS